MGQASHPPEAQGVKRAQRTYPPLSPAILSTAAQGAFDQRSIIGVFLNCNLLESYEILAARFLFFWLKASNTCLKCTRYISVLVFANVVSSRFRRATTLPYV